MAQNIYDEEVFFERYTQRPRQKIGLEGAPEWPQLRAMLPRNLTGLRVLDLGCGMGFFCRWALANGAESTHGVDLSHNMLSRARAQSSRAGNETYEQTDLDGLQLPAQQYDVVLSSLAFHYLLHLDELMKQIHKTLRPGGRFVFCVEHPIFTAPREIFESPAEAVIQTDEKTGRRYWPIDAYQHEGLRVRNWHVEGVRKQHRTVATYIRILLGAGFELTDFVEWYPTEEEMAADPETEGDMIRPRFLVMAANKKKCQQG